MYFLMPLFPSWFGFMAFPIIFHSYRANRSSKVGENQGTLRETTWPVSRIVFFTCDPNLARTHSRKSVLLTIRTQKHFLYINKAYHKRNNIKTIGAWRQYHDVCMSGQLLSFLTAQYVKTGKWIVLWPDR